MKRALDVQFSPSRRIALVDPAKARSIEDRIIALAQRGQVSQVREEDGCNRDYG